MVAPPDPSESYRCVGEFLWHFAQLEEAINDGIARICELNQDHADIITANMDFVRKLNIVKSVATLEGEEKSFPWVPDIKSTFNGILNANNWRTVIAHSTFEPDGNGGVRFNRVAARGALERKEPTLTRHGFDQQNEKMRALKTKLRLIVNALTPYTPSLDFSDPRNSIYLALLF